MHPILSSFVAAMLSIHALLGCCWHHAHGCIVCELVMHEAASPQVSPKASCCHHEHNAAPHEPSHQDPTHQAPCECQIDCRGTCAFLPTPRAPAIDRDSAPADCFVACLPAIATSRIGPSLSWQFGSGPAQLEPPLRLHLLHQILLI